MQRAQLFESAVGYSCPPYWLPVPTPVWRPMSMSEATSPYSWPLSICFAGDMIEAAVHGGPGVPPNQLAQGSESWSDLPWVPRPAAGMAGPRTRVLSQPLQCFLPHPWPMWAVLSDALWKYLGPDCSWLASQGTKKAITVEWSVVGEGPQRTGRAFHSCLGRGNRTPCLRGPCLLGVSAG